MGGCCQANDQHSRGLQREGGVVSVTDMNIQRQPKILLDATTETELEDDNKSEEEKQMRAQL